MRPYNTLHIACLWCIRTYSIRNVHPYLLSNTVCYPKIVIKTGVNCTHVLFNLKTNIFLFQVQKSYLFMLTMYRQCCIVKNILRSLCVFCVNKTNKEYLYPMCLIQRKSSSCYQVFYCRNLVKNLLER